MESECDRDFSEVHLTSSREINWSVRNLNSTGGEPLDSPPFVLQNATWCLRLYPCVDDDIGLRIVRLSSRVPRHKLKYSLKLKDDQTSYCCNADFDKDQKQGYLRAFAQHMGHSREMIRKMRSEVINVTCEISCYGLYAADGFSQTELSMQEIKDVEVLRRDFKNIQLNGQNHDVVLKVKDKEFRAHRDVLQARSPVFRSMMDHDMTEKNVGVIDILDCDPSAFEQFLLYLYSGPVDTLNAGNMLSLYYVADKYDAGHLKETCRDFIKRSLTTRNITDVVQLALDHSDEDLLRWATDYFVKEVNGILPTVEWMSFMKRNAVQANELFVKAAKDMTGSKEMDGKT